jgi:8-oxo-dGTP diphosphatase
MDPQKGESVSVLLAKGSSSVRIRAFIYSSLFFFLTSQNNPMMKPSIDIVCAVIKSADVINKGRNDLFLIA